MNTGIQDIFCVRVQDKYLLYAPRLHFSALLNEAAVRSIYQGIFKAKHLTGELGQVAELLSREGETSPAPGEGPISSPFFLGLIPTRGCNLNCRYCDFMVPRRSTPTMSLELARQAIDAYIQLIQANGRSLVEIHFFGGEPFVAWEVVFFAVEYARWQAERKNLHTRFEVITNGVVSADRCRWIADHFDAVVLSLDGMAASHEAQRPAPNGKSTYPLILKNAIILADGPAELALRTCVTRENVSEMVDFGRWCGQELKPASICFETLDESPVSRQSHLAPCTPMEFVRNFIAVKKSLIPLGINTVLSTDAAEECQFSFCPVGKDAIIVSPRGSVDGCYWLPEEWVRKGLDLKLGIVTESGFELKMENVQRVRQAAALQKELCQDCFCQYHCAGGCHIRRVGHSKRQYNEICFQTRLITLWRLLSELGQEALADAMLQDQAAAEAFVHLPSDRLSDLKEVV